MSSDSLLIVLGCAFAGGLHLTTSQLVFPITLTFHGACVTPFLYLHLRHTWWHIRRSNHHLQTACPHHRRPFIIYRAQSTVLPRALSSRGLSPRLRCYEGVSTGRSASTNANTFPLEGQLEQRNQSWKGQQYTGKVQRVVVCCIPSVCDFLLRPRKKWSGGCGQLVGWRSQTIPKRRSSARQKAQAIAMQRADNLISFIVEVIDFPKTDLRLRG